MALWASNVSYSDGELSVQFEMGVFDLDLNFTFSDGVLSVQYEIGVFDLDLNFTFSDGELSVQYEVGVFDLDRPWEWYPVMRTHSVVTCLEWDKMGNSLLIADADGKCQVWQMEVGLCNI